MVLLCSRFSISESTIELYWPKTSLFVWWQRNVISLLWSNGQLCVPVEVARTREQITNRVNVYLHHGVLPLSLSNCLPIQLSRLFTIWNTKEEYENSLRIAIPKYSLRITIIPLLQGFFLMWKPRSWRATFTAVGRFGIK